MLINVMLIKKICRTAPKIGPVPVGPNVFYISASSIQKSKLQHLVYSIVKDLAKKGTAPKSNEASHC